jgi:hypothetical protein
LLVKKFFGIIPATMMDWSNSRENADAEATVQPCEGGPERAAKGVRLIADYLENEAALGRLQSTNCEALAQTFVGALWHYAFLQVTLGDVYREPLTPNQYVDEVVQTLMFGISPKGKIKTKK